MASACLESSGTVTNGIFVGHCSHTHPPCPLCMHAGPFAFCSYAQLCRWRLSELHKWYSCKAHTGYVLCRTLVDIVISLATCHLLRCLDVLFCWFCVGNDNNSSVNEQQNRLLYTPCMHVHASTCKHMYMYMCPVHVYVYIVSLQVQVDRRRGGRTALHCAAVTKNTELIKLLLEFGANREAEV